MWLLVAHTITRRNDVTAADVQNPIHTCNDFFLSHPLLSIIGFVCGWSEFGSKFIYAFTMRFVFCGNNFQMYGFFFTIIAILWNVNWPSLVVLKHIGFSRAGDVELNGGYFLRNYSSQLWLWWFPFIFEINLKCLIYIIWWTHNIQNGYKCDFTISVLLHHFLLTPEELTSEI